MAKFYDLHLDDGLPPATALKQTQAWLRAATREELIAYGKSAAAKAKMDSTHFTALETKLASRSRSPDTHFDEIANVVQDKTFRHLVAWARRQRTSDRYRIDLSNIPPIGEASSSRGYD
jgi:CHAT domain-containing protein